jgi:acetyl esterase/lipase
MTLEYRVVGLMRRRHAWLAVTIAAAVLSGQIAQPVMARRRPMELANAAIQQDLVYERVNGPIEEHQATAIQASPLQYVSNDDPPFLIIHGNEDRTVPVTQCQLVADALKRAGVETTLKIANGRGHGIGGHAFDSLIKSFFYKHLKQGVSR